MSNYGYFEGDDPAEMFNMLQRRGMGGGPPKRFAEHYRCYNSVLLPGNEREFVQYGSKIFLPASALDKLSRLHIEWPMNFEIINGRDGFTTHGGVLEFIAEEGRVYMAKWMMDTLHVNDGDLLEVKSTSLKPAQLVKLQPQSADFLEISDPKAVLENAFRNFATLTKGDVFKFKYNENIYGVEVLEVKPQSDKMGVSMLETDVSVDFAPPVGYVDPPRNSGTNTPKTIKELGGAIHPHGAMAEAINYNSIKPTANAAALGAKAVSSHFISEGHKLVSRKGSKAPTPNPSTPVNGRSTNAPPQPPRRINGPQPLRLAPGTLFFGYDVIPVKTQADKDKENAAALRPHFAGQGHTLKPGVKRKSVEPETEVMKEPEPSVGRRLDGRNVI